MYYYCPHSGVSLRSPPPNLQASRDLWRQIENGRWEVDAMAESVWQNIVAQTEGAKNAVSSEEGSATEQSEENLLDVLYWCLLTFGVC